MKENILLCADSESMKDPSLIGLPGEGLSMLSWLACETDAEACRAKARSRNGFDEAWVVSCDDMESINVAAAIKHDGFCGKVFLVVDGQNGSLASRASNAHIDGLWSEAMFARRYAQAKAQFAVSRGSEKADFGVDSFSGFSDASRARGDAGTGLCSGALSAGHVEGAGGGIFADSCDSRNEESRDRSGSPSFGKSDASAPKGLQDELQHSGSIGPSAAVAQAAQGNGGSAFRKEDQDALPYADSAPRVSYAVKGTPVKEGPGTVVAVVGGSGGCGKSTLSAVFALMASRAGLKTAAFDADLQFGDLDYLLGVSSPLRIEEVRDDPSRLNAVTTAPKAPLLVAAPRRLEVSELVAGEVVPMISAMKRAFDAVVVNTGAMWGDGHAGILEMADAVVFVMDRRPSSLRATVHAVELCARLGIATTGFTFVVNRYEKGSLLTAVDVSCALRGSRAVELADGGRDVDELLGAGYPDELLESRNVFIEGARGLLADILPERRAEMLCDGRKGSSKRRRTLFGKGGPK